MSLSAALFIIVIELVIATVSVAMTKSPRRRAQRLYRVFGAFAGLMLVWSIGLAGTLEAFGSAPGLFTLIALTALNAAIFLTAKNAYERLYGIDPA